MGLTKLSSGLSAEERLEIILGRVVKIVAVGVASTMVTVVGATAWVVRLDSRVSFIEQDVRDASEALTRLADQQTEVQILQRETQEARARIVELYKRLRRMECKQNGGKDCNLLN